MILIDAVYINKSGGKVLLDYLIANIEDHNIDCFYLLDNRVSGDYNQIPKERKQFIKAGLWNRFRFYLSKRKQFKKVLCFGNIPPMLACPGKVYTYFHQLLFLDVPANVSSINKFKIGIKTYILKFLSKNTDYFVVQSEQVQQALAAKYSIALTNVLVIPFYPELPALEKPVKKIANSFLYVSSGAPHKNHKLLIAAFIDFYKARKTGSLTFTLGAEDTELLDLLHKAKTAKIPIENIGFVPREALAEHYAASEYLIYPSLAESFGLGLIEAIAFDCKILAADLPYTYQVCEPSLVFNPHSKDDIVHVFEQSVSKNIPPTKPIILNKIDLLIDKLS